MDHAGTTRTAFNPVDEVVHVLETEAEPWSIQLELRVAGSLDEERLRTALDEAVRRHPMARARKAATQRRTEHRYYWEVAPAAEIDPLRVVECPDDEALSRTRAELQSRIVPLVESPPFRLRLARTPGGDVLMANANHAAMDGFGTLRLLRSVARAYAGDPDPVPDLDPLAARDLRALVGGADGPTRLRRAALLGEKLRDLVTAPARLAPDGATRNPGYGLHHERVPGETTARVLGADLPGTVNDLLLAALHLAVAGWNEEHGRPARRIGVMVPVNMRPAEWRAEVVGNLLLPVRVTTGRADRSSPEAALAAVVSQTERLKRAGTSGALIEVLGRSPSLPLGVKEATSPLLNATGNRLVDTALLSNLGNLDDPPSFGADAGATTEVWFSAPARMPLGLSLGVVTVAGRLHLAFRYRHPLFGPDAARRFAERYLATLDRFVTP